MQIFTGILTYCLMWMLIFFMVLPMGVRTQQQPEQGHELGAPEKADLRFKVFLTTGLATLLWLAFYWASETLPVRAWLES